MLWFFSWLLFLFGAITLVVGLYGFMVFGFLLRELEIYDLEENLEDSVYSHMVANVGWAAVGAMCLGFSMAI